MSEDTMLNEAIEAAREGNRARARDLLTRLLRTDQSNPDYWLWMSSVVDTPKEQVYCLRSVLRLEPHHRVARRGLIVLGADEADDSIKPVPPARRQRWQVAEIEGDRPTGLAALVTNPAVRLGGGLILGLGLIALILAGFFNFQSRQRNDELQSLIRLTLTAQPSPTLTVQPTLTWTPIFRSPTPTFIRPTPLWMLLEATYTPTPLYVNTPHPSAEAYRAGIRAYERGQWNQVIQFMEQVLDILPDAPDAHYYIGEAHRFLGDYFQAIQAYNNALDVNVGFAPAYLGRARSRLAIDPEADVTADLDEAIIRDSNLGEAFLERARQRTAGGDPEAALEDLEIAGLILPDSPLVALERARAYLELENYQAAESAAERANELDITLLPAYLLLGQAQLQGGDPRGAISPLNTYLLYDQENATAWMSLALAHQENHDVEEALEAFNNALELDPSRLDLYLLRGVLYTETGEEELAIDDLSRVVRFRPQSFEANLELGKAYYAFEQFGNAYVQFNETLGMTDEEEQLATLYYWRALSLEALDEPAAATRDWEALLALPEEAVPQEWISLAEAHILQLNPPTPTNTGTPTVTLTPTPSPPPTDTPAPTLTRTPVPTASPTP